MKVVTARKAQWWGVFVELTCVKVAALCFAALAALGVRAETWTDPDTGLTWHYEIRNGGAEKE